MNVRQIRLPLAPCIFVFALLVRLLVLNRLASSGLLLPTAGDMRFYSDWAHQVAHGNFSDGHAFYGLPGYPWLLAVFFKVGGTNPFWVLLAQCGLDAGTAVLLYRISTCVFAGRTAQFIGGLAACMWVFCVPAQSYCAVLMPVTLVVFVGCLVVWRLVRNEHAPGVGSAATLGLVIGLTANAVAMIVPLLGLVLGAIWLRPSRPDNALRRRILATLLAIAATLAGTAPCWAHNIFLAHDRVFLSAHSGINFWIGNNPQANGYPHFPPGLRAGQIAMLQDSIDVAEKDAGRPLKRGEVSRYWAAKAGQYIRKHPWAWMKLLALKCRNIFNAFQYDDLSVITILREEGITFPGFRFGLIAALAFPGMVFAWSRAPLCRWLALTIGLHLLALLPVFTTERYRLPLVPGLIIFAAFGVVLLWESIAAGNLRPTFTYGTLLGASALFVSWPQRDPSLWALDAYNTGRQALEMHNLPLAQTKLQVARAYVPTNPETNFALGNLKLAQHDEPDAVRFYLTALQFDPRHRGALNNLGVLALENGNMAVAEQRFRDVIAVDRRDAKAHFLLAKTLIAQGENARARSELELAIDLAPGQKEFRALRETTE